MNAIREALVLVLQDVDPETINADTVLRSIPGWDSMNAVTFLIFLEEKLGSSLADVDLATIKTIGDLQRDLVSRGVTAAAS